MYHTKYKILTKEDSSILKGIAILMMLFLHLFMNADIVNYCSPLLFVAKKPLVFFLTRACTPVPFFLILSGYGLSYIYYNKNLNFKSQFKRIIKLYIHYWIVLLIFVPIVCYFKADYIGSFFKVLCNIIGCGQLYDAPTWFLFPYALLSLTAVWIFKVIDLLGPLKSAILSFILSLVSCYIISRYIAVTKNYDAIYTPVLTYFDLQFSFVLGALLHRLAEYRGLIINQIYNHKYLSLLVLLSLIILKCFFTTSAFDAIYSIIFIIIFINIYSGFAKSIFYKLGSFSMLMWMIHFFIYSFLLHDLIYSFKYPFFIFVALILISYLVSIPIMKICNFIICGVKWMK
jgi:hypothetical protein